MKFSGSQMDSLILCPFSGWDLGKWQRVLAYENLKRRSKVIYSAPGSLLVPTEASLSVPPALVTTEAYTTGYILVYTTRDHGVSYLASSQSFYLICIINQKQNNNNNTEKPKTLN